METDPSLWSYYAEASLVVKTVMMLLLAASLLSWTLIIQKAFHIKAMREKTRQFTDRFWSSKNLLSLYRRLEEETQQGLPGLFVAGFKEYMRFQKREACLSETHLTAVQRSMAIHYRKELETLEAHLPTLASIGSVSPYIGLFGTVWGIMTSFQGLSQSTQQVSIAMVAPGISEALVATAMGLFVAIPAVLAYNRYTHQVSSLANAYETFQESFFNLLVMQQQVQSSPNHPTQNQAHHLHSPSGLI